MTLHAALSCIGITWGLPSRTRDKFLFGDGDVWSGEKIYRLAHAEHKFSATSAPNLGADVDVDRMNNEGRQFEGTNTIPLTGNDEDVAKIYLRYLLYTYQPDEMITMMALAGMRLGQLEFDPRLYQYGGLFIYPVGALIKLCGLIGLIDVRNDIAWYLDHPDEFGKFYIVARAYSAAWGFVGVVVVFALTRRLIQDIAVSGAAGWNRDDSITFVPLSYLAALLAALLFALMPVVVCMSHEGKPHLPGAVLMLLSVYLAIRTVEANQPSQIANQKYFWLMCVCCGAAVGMVLSSWPICVLIPLTAFFQHRKSKIEDRKLASLVQSTIVGGLSALAVYFATNPYVLMNLFANREVLRSNFGNSLAMYEVSRIGEGFLRVLALTVEGTGFFVSLLGVVALAAAMIKRRLTASAGLLIIPAFLFFTQFVLLGAGKPAEYGRFGIFTDAVLVVAAAILITSPRMFAFVFLLAAIPIAETGVQGFRYTESFHLDALESGSRIQAAQRIVEQSTSAAPSIKPIIVVPVEPAPYSCPPLNFAVTNVVLARDADLNQIPKPFLMVHFEEKADLTPISWANKTFWVRSSTTPLTWNLPYKRPTRPPDPY